MTQRPSLDLDGVQAFVLTAELGSFTRAAEALDVSQAAISLRLKRLEDRLGLRLLERTPRHVRLSARGQAFLPAAQKLLEAHEAALAGCLDAPPQRLVLGISDHVAGAELPGMLRRLGIEGAGLVVEVRIAASPELKSAYDRGEIDAVIIRDEEEPPRGTVLSREKLAWFAAPGFSWRAGETLPLASLACPCGVRAIATRALDQAGLSWSEAFVGGGVLALGAAVSAGLGIAALAPRVAPAAARDVGDSLGLPPLPSFPIVLHAGPLEGRAQAAIRALAAAYRTAPERPALVA